MSDYDLSQYGNFTPIDLKQKKIDDIKSDIHSTYRKHLDAIRNSTGSNTMKAIVDLNNFADTFPAEDKVASLQQEIDSQIAQRQHDVWGDQGPSPLDTYLISQRNLGRDLGMGAQEIYYENKDKLLGSPESAKDLADFRAKQAADNEMYYKTNPAKYPFAEQGRDNEGRLNSVVDFAGRAVPLTVGAVLTSRLFGPLLGMPAATGIAAAAENAVPHEAMFAYLNNVGLQTGYDTVIGALDQNSTAGNAFLTSFALNNLLRLPMQALQRIPNVPNQELRDTIKLGRELNDAYGNAPKLFGGNWWDVGNDLHIDRPQVVRGPTQESSYNALMRSPWSRDVLDEHMGDRQGFFAKMIKNTLLPGSGDVPYNMENTIDPNWMQTYKKVAQDGMNAVPKNDLVVDLSDLEKGLNKVQELYGDDALQIPAVKKHFGSVISMFEKNAVADADGVVRKGIMTPQFYDAKIKELSASIDASQAGSQTQKILKGLRDELMDAASRSDPDFAHRVESGRLQWAAYKRLQKFVDPITGRVNLTALTDSARDDLINGKGIPINYDLNGVQRNLFNDLAKVSWLVDPKKMASATLHDNQLAAAAHTDESASKALENKGLLKRVTGVANLFGQDIGSIPLRYNLKDFGFGFSPAQINMTKNMISPTTTHSIVSSNPDAESISEQEDFALNAYRDYLQREAQNPFSKTNIEKRMKAGLYNRGKQ